MKNRFAYEWYDGLFRFNYIRTVGIHREERNMDILKKIKQKTGIYGCFMIGMISLIVILGLLSLSEGFCNLYSDTVYVVNADVTAYLTSPVPFPLGEILMYVFAIITIVLLILICLFPLIKKKGKAGIVICGIKSYGMIVVVVLLIYILNWVIPFKSACLSAKDNPKGSYSLDELEKLREYAVNGLNTAALESKRNENGNLMVDLEFSESVNQAMSNLADDYVRLRGYYPKVKEALCSDFLWWMGIGGFTYPYSMEVTCNRYCSYLYKPVLYAHEQAHHKGYYKENEAEFLSIIACVQSDDTILNYSGWLEMYGYVNKAYVYNLYRMLTKEEADNRLKNAISLSEQVVMDVKTANEDSEERYAEQVSVFAERYFKDISEKTAETGWSVQDNVLGEMSYDGVVGLLLDYYFG